MNEFERALDDLESLVPLEKRFSYQGKKYLLREPDGEAVRLWRAGLVRNRQFTSEGRPTSVEGTESSDAQLIAFCIRELISGNDWDTARPMTSDEVLKFQHRVVDTLWDWVSWAAGFSEDETVESLNVQIEGLTRQRDQLLSKEGSLKNGSAATTASSA